VSAAVYKDRGSLYNREEEKLSDRQRCKEKNTGRERGKEMLGLLNEYKWFLRAAFIRQYL